MHRTAIAALALVAAVVTLTTAAMAAAPAASAPRSAAAKGLDFQASLPLYPTSVPCPADVPPGTTECDVLTLFEVGSIHRLGRVSEATYTLPLAMGPPTCPAGFSRPLATSGRLTVAGRGEITFTLAEGTRCVSVRIDDVFDLDEVLDPIVQIQEFTITGGTGHFAGASGSGQVERYLGHQETWTGTLRAPGLHLDLPRLIGAVAKTTRAAKGTKSARVAFEVTATDDEDGAIPVSCYPASGSRFALGKSTVTCVATDSSGNTATAEFTVTVKRGR